MIEVSEIALYIGVVLAAIGVLMPFVVRTLNGVKQVLDRIAEAKEEDSDGGEKVTTAEMILIIEDAGRIVQFILRDTLETLKKL